MTRVRSIAVCEGCDKLRCEYFNHELKCYLGDERSGISMGTCRKSGRWPWFASDYEARVIPRRCPMRGKHATALALREL